MKHHPITYPTLNFKAQEIGYHPEMILAGRRINDGIGAYVAHQIIQLMARRSRCPTSASPSRKTAPTSAKLAFDELHGYGVTVDVHDPWADPTEAKTAPVADSGWPRRVSPPRHDESKNPLMASVAKQSKQPGYGNGGQTRPCGRFWIAASAIVFSQ